MVDSVFSNKLEGTVTLVFFEHSDDSLGEGNAEPIGLGIDESDKVVGLEVALRVSSRVDVDLMIFADRDGVDFGDELDLLLGGGVEGDGPAESVEMVVGKRFLRERRTSVGDGSECERLVVDRCLRHCVHIPSDQFQLCIHVLLTRVVVDCHPPSQVGLRLILRKGQRVVCAPAEACCAIGHLAAGGLGLCAPHVPGESGGCEETVGEGGKINTDNVIEDLDSSFGLEDVARGKAQQLSSDPASLVNHVHKYGDLLFDVFVQNTIGVDQVLFEVLFVDPHALRLLNGLESHSRGLDTLRNVGEVEGGLSFIEGNAADVLDHGKIVVVDSDSEGLLTLDLGGEGEGNESADEERFPHKDYMCHHFQIHKKVRKS